MTFVHIPLIFVHIAGGSVALLAGTAALWFRKGGRNHVAAGTLFFAAMLVLSITGATIAAFIPGRLSVVSGILTGYLVATSWAAARRRDGRTGNFEIIALLVAGGCAGADLTFGLQALISSTGHLEGFPAAAYFAFAAVAGLAAGLDINFILRRTASPAQRIARHLWRVCTALFIASASFFLGQQKVMPAFMQGSPILILPAVAPLVLMAFWLARVQFPNVVKRIAPRARKLSDHFGDRELGSS